MAGTLLPALLNTTSSRPKRFSVSANRVATAAESVTSQLTGRA